VIPKTAGTSVFVLLKSWHVIHVSMREVAVTSRDAIQSVVPRIAGERLCGIHKMKRRQVLFVCTL
jgi:hypothetical protein